jgi:hypothetical protein
LEEGRSDTADFPQGEPAILLTVQLAKRVNDLETGKKPGPSELCARNCDSGTTRRLRTERNAIAETSIPS